MALDPNFGRVVPSNVSLEAGDGWRRRNVGTATEHLHQGLDIRLPTGTPILAAADGTVSQVSPTSTSDAGIFVAVTHPSGLTSRYLHLSRASVTRGQRVVKGQQLGLSGSTGNSAAPHLHFDLWAPDALLPAVAAAVGQPTTGFGSRLQFGVAIPSEPWLPVDSYALVVVASARQLGIPLLKDRPRTSTISASRSRAFAIAFVVGGFAGLSWLAWRIGARAAVPPSQG